MNNFIILREKEFLIAQQIFKNFIREYDTFTGNKKNPRNKFFICSRTPNWGTNFFLKVFSSKINFFFGNLRCL